MASVLANGPIPTVVLTRGRATKLGTLGATGNVVQFTLPQENYSPNGLDCLTIATVGAGSAAGLAASIDGGITWFGILPRAITGTSPNFTLTALNGDTAYTSANSYDVSGLQAGALFRFGTWASGSAAVWALFP